MLSAHIDAAILAHCLFGGKTCAMAYIGVCTVVNAWRYRYRIGRIEGLSTKKRGVRMKVSVLLESDVTRLFLSPENVDDKNMLAGINKDKMAVQIFVGLISTTVGGFDKIGSAEDGLVFRFSKANGESKKEMV